MSSEPKSSTLDEPSARKASKKSSKRPSDATVNPSASPSYTVAGSMEGPSQLSAASAAASPIPRLHDVPRIPIAEPKAAATTGDSVPGAGSGGGEPKPRASKKRTASPPDATMVTSTGGPSLPPSSSTRANNVPTVGTATAATAAAKDTADAEREKQVAGARREAKRQRAKELEDAKHRNELAKQAVEDAKRAEEARMREQRRKQELAALNANAEECQEEEEGQGGDYEDDGFENYDDDFEDDTKPPEKAAGGKTQPAQATGSNNISPAELKKIQQALQAESKELSTSRPPSSSLKASESNNQSLPTATAVEKKKKSGSATSTSIASSIAGLKQSLDPRVKRAKEVLDTRKFEVEKFNLFHQAPLSEQETYVSSLRRGHVRQVAVYTNDGAKAAATQTKCAAGTDKSMLFPDDIGLDSDASASTTGSGDTGDSSAGVHSTVRFFNFLEHAAYACELLAEGNTAAAECELEESMSAVRKRFAVSTNTALSAHQVLPNQQFDDPAVETLLHGRDLVALRFSPCASNILVTCYGPQKASAASNREQRCEVPDVVALLKDKGVSCVWDVNQPRQALHVLKNEGLLAAVCLSPHRELLALAGTDDGSIHVWDLRRQPYRSVSSKDEKESANFKVKLALCSPTYSTCGADYKASSQHASTIVGLEVVVRANESHGAGSGTFQFGSMDDRGIVIIWSLIEFEAGEDALTADKCVEIGGRVKMVMNTLIDTQQQYMEARPAPQRRLEKAASSLTSASSKTASSSSSRSATPLSSDQVCSVGPIATVLKFFPHDPNQCVCT